MLEMQVYCSGMNTKVSIVQEYMEQTNPETRVKQLIPRDSYCRFQLLCKIEDCSFKIGKAGRNYIASKSI